MATTRISVTCPIFGDWKDLSVRCLPTYEDVMKYYHKVRSELKSSNKEPTFKDIAALVTERLEYLWKLASIPAVSNARIHQILKTYRDKMASIIKSMKSKKKNENQFQKNLNEFQNLAKTTLFDISACKCPDFTKCSCPPERQVPLKEQKFLLDQRNERKMAIGTLDVATTQKIKMTCARRLARLKQEGNVEQQEPSTSKQEETSQEQLSSSASSNNEDTASTASSLSYEPTPKEKVSMMKETKMTLHAVAEACDRTGISDRVAAFIASSTLQDVGSIQENVATAVIDRNKIRRARKRVRSEHQKNDKITLPLQGIFFDGRKDKTMTHEEIDNVKHKRIVVEEHIVLVQEPESQYIGHFTPASGCATAITSGIINFLETNNISTDDIVAIGCDGTAVNTGQKGGAIRMLENKLQRPVQWVICLLHGNELPLRHLIQDLDGKTTGPVGFTGPIGKQLNECEKIPVAEFDAIPSPNIDIDDAELSTDQKYLLDIYREVSRGSCSSALAARNPGKMAHSRWLTTANRILRLYVSTAEPSSSLIEIVRYIMTVYAPIWFKVKKNSSFTEGAKHFFEMMRLSQTLPKRCKTIINKVLHRNAFFAHPENILISMIHDKEQHVRELGWRRIIKARSKQSPEGEVRSFAVPELIYDSQNYYGMINWQKTEVTEPPVTRTIPDAQINEFIKTGDQPEGLIPLFPCHTQAVERLIKLVTDASASVSGREKRDGFIRSRLHSRTKIPRFETKKDYRV